MTVQPRHDPPAGRYLWRHPDVPAHLMTRRQLAAAGLSRRGLAPVAELRRARGRLTAYLYDSRQARPKRTDSDGTARTLAAMRAARRRCRACGRDAGYVVPRAAPYCPDCC